MPLFLIILADFVTLGGHVHSRFCIVYFVVTTPILEGKLYYRLIWGELPSNITTVTVELEKGVSRLSHTHFD